MSFKHKGSSRNPEGRSLARKRRLCGLTQHDVAHAASIPINRLVFAETGRLDLEPEEVQKIRVVLRKRARQVMDTIGR